MSDNSSNHATSPASKKWVKQQASPIFSGSGVETGGQELEMIAKAQPALSVQPQKLPVASNQGKELLQNASSVYDAATLLALGAIAPSKHIELRIHPGALKENLFKNHAPEGACKGIGKARSQGFCNDTANTHRKANTDDGPLSRHDRKIYLRPLSRDPRPVPETIFKLEEENFAKFREFKEKVASPPHQRVTAGGRVVPAGPQSPPPMINFGSINDSIRRGAYEHLGERTGSAGVQRRLRQSQMSSNERQAKDAEFAAWRAQLFTTLQYPTGMVPVMFHPAGGAVVTCNGCYYRVYWNGPELIQEPLTIHPSGSPSPESSIDVYNQVAQGFYQGQLAPSVAAPIRQSTSAHMTDQYPVSSTKTPGEAHSEATSRLHDGLRSELSLLDKHVALNLHKLTPFENAAYAARRERLVEQIDYYRTIKTKRVESSNPAPKTTGLHDQHFLGSRYAPFGNASPSMSKTAATNTSMTEQGYHFREACQIIASEKSPACQSTCLSPIAPPFVPSNPNSSVEKSNVQMTDAMVDSCGRVHIPRDNGRSNGSQSVDAAPTQTPFEPISTANKSAARNFSIVTNENQRPAENLTDKENQVLMALPEVAPQQAEYADRLGINPPNKEKMFCTTVQEFQEVIRRAREQARIYGGLGSSTLAMAVDAEEEIRWAMEDHEPIPLPTSIPDHITNPGPWNWNRSVFNVRAHGKYAPFISAARAYLSGGDKFNNWGCSSVASFEKRKSARANRTPTDSGNSAQPVQGVNCEAKTSDSAVRTKLAEAKTNRPSDPVGQHYTPRKSAPGSATNSVQHSSQRVFKDKYTRSPPKQLVPDLSKLPVRPVYDPELEAYPGMSVDELAKVEPSKYSNVSIDNLRQLVINVNGYSLLLPPNNSWKSIENIGTDEASNDNLPKFIYVETPQHVLDKYPSLAFNPEVGLKTAGNYGKQRVSFGAVSLAVIPPYPTDDASPLRLTSQSKFHVSPSAINKGETNRLLRELLKSPPYSVAGANSSDRSVLKGRRPGLEADLGHNGPQDVANKENLKSEDPYDDGQGGRPGFTATHPPQISQDARNHKAESSLASFNYNAHGSNRDHHRTRDHFPFLADQSRKTSAQSSGLGNVYPRLGMNPRSYTNYIPQYLPQYSVPRYDGTNGSSSANFEYFQHRSAQQNTSSTEHLGIALDDTRNHEGVTFGAGPRMNHEGAVFGADPCMNTVINRYPGQWPERQA